MTFVQVRIPGDLRDAIDAERGDVPRERWVRRALEAALRDRVGDSAGSGRAITPAVESRQVGREAAPVAASPRTPVAAARRTPRKAKQEAEPSGDGIPLPKYAKRHWT